MRLPRSYLFAPGNRQTLIGKVFNAGADAVVLDLEDAVPESEKAQARADVAAALSHDALLRLPRPDRSPEVFVRVNSLDSPHWRSDIDSIIGPAVHGVRVPKAESIDSLCRLNDLLSDREHALGLRSGAIRVVATIETARGLFQIDSIARSPRLSGLAFGKTDFCADVSADPKDETATLFSRSMLVAVSRNRRLPPPIASVFTSLDDDEGLRADTERQKRLGFFGRSAIHPRQVPVIHAVFKPTPDEVTAARRVVADYEAGEREGRGALRTAGAFVDLAVVRRARATVELHEIAEGDQK